MVILEAINRLLRLLVSALIITQTQCREVFPAPVVGRLLALARPLELEAQQLASGLEQQLAES